MHKDNLMLQRQAQLSGKKKQSLVIFDKIAIFHIVNYKVYKKIYIHGTNISHTTFFVSLRNSLLIIRKIFPNAKCIILIIQLIPTPSLVEHCTQISDISSLSTQTRKYSEILFWAKSGAQNSVRAAMCTL
jgi:hypothetical protein